MPVMFIGFSSLSVTGADEGGAEVQTDDGAESKQTSLPFDVPSLRSCESCAAA